MKMCVRPILVCRRRRYNVENDLGADFFFFDSQHFYRCVCGLVSRSVLRFGMAAFFFSVSLPHSIDWRIPFSEYFSFWWHAVELSVLRNYIFALSSVVFFQLQIHANQKKDDPISLALPTFRSFLFIQGRSERSKVEKNDDFERYD